MVKNRVTNHCDKKCVNKIKKRISKVFLVFLAIIMRTLFFYTLLLVLCINSYAQNKTIDSLLINLNTQKEDTNKVKTLKNLCWRFGDIGDYEKAISYASKGITLAQNLNFKKGLSMCYTEIGIIYESQSNYPKALECHTKALKINEELGNKKGISISFDNIGMIYHNQSNYPKALEYYTKSLKIDEEFGNKKGISKCYNNIGIIYDEQKNYTKALEYYTKSLKIDKVLGEKYGMSKCYNNFGGIYYAQSNYSKALEYYTKALKIDEELGDKKGIAVVLLNLSQLNNELKKYSFAKKQTEQVISISKEIGEIENMRLAYEELAKAEEGLGNFKAAYLNHKKFKELTDSIFNKENSEQLSDIKTNYEVEKKEAQLKAKAESQELINNEQKKRQQFIIYAVAGILLVVIIFSALLYKRFRLTNKQKQIIELKEKETQQQNEIIKVQKLLVEEKQKEIIESISYAKRLQEAILPPQDFVNAHLKNNFIYYQPKDIVAGDFYWSEKVGDLFFIAVADSTGHGVPGAMVSVVCSNALNRTIKEFNLIETGKILDKTRDLVIETFEKSVSEIKDGMDISLLCIDSKNKNIYWSGANNSLWYINENELKEIKADKQPIGKIDCPKQFTTHQIEYKKETTFYLFTDGLADQFGGPNGKKFKYKPFKELLISINQKTMQEQANIIEQAIDNWKNDLEQVDDICVIGIKI